MRALTLKQPWAWAVAHAGKRVENRTWRPPAALIGQRIAIHAGVAYDGDAFLGDLLFCLGSPLREPARRHHVYGAVVATAVIDRVVTDSGSPWFCGPFGWVLRDVVTLREPVPCKGALGLWTLSHEVEEAVARQSGKE